VIGQRIQIIPDAEWDDFYSSLDITRKAGTFTGFETTRMRKDGSLIYVSLSAAPLVDGKGNINGSVVVIADITERKHLEEQFLQAQKMEAIGRLAGGVAHDFNNLLTAIIGYSQLVFARLHRQDPMRKEIQEIERAGHRAAGLTNQLLAFSRRQVLQPQVLDLNAVVADLARMLERLIGEDIVLATSLAPDIGFVKADRGQIEQIIMNLAVNSRDAMPDGGKLTIETFNTELDESYTAEHINAHPGPHVVLAVSDTGSGIDRETQLNIFEPFFTTKEQGKGTGLGLSTVYGIVQQSGGHIGLYSELGRGTHSSTSRDWRKRRYCESRSLQRIARRLRNRPVGRREASVHELGCAGFWRCTAMWSLKRV
jgi:signal transduction histidine kinase